MKTGINIMVELQLLPIMVILIVALGYFNNNVGSRACYVIDLLQYTIRHLEFL